MRIGQIFRYARPYNCQPPEIDGLPNFFNVTSRDGLALPLLDRGINPVGQVIDLNGVVRNPAILISSSPHKIGSSETPWQDFFDPDNGHIHYFGDNKLPDKDPYLAPGNKALLQAYKVHSSPDPNVRLHATPIIFFRRVSMNGRVKGFVQFQGFGIIKNVQLITQYDRKNNSYFANYSYDFVVFSLSTERENFDWEWINIRREALSSLEETLRYAPTAWRFFIKEGSKAVERNRRRISKLFTAKPIEQIPKQGMAAHRTLLEIYHYYASKKARFEALAVFVTQSVIALTGREYRIGWITPATSDGGSDFIGRLDVGSGFSSVRIVVLGQAKCEKLNVPTSGRDIARTVARLRRGWIGVYVTTSYFSEAVQREIIEDKYPLLLIHGLRLAEEVSSLAHKEGFPSVQAFLDNVDSKYNDLVRIRHPEEILRDP